MIDADTVVQQIDQLGQETCVGRFHHDTGTLKNGPPFVQSTRFLDGALFSKRSPDAKSAREFREFTGGPPPEDIRVARLDLRNDRIRCGVESLMTEPRRGLEEFVRDDPEALGKPVERPGLRRMSSASNPTDGTRIKAGSRDDIVVSHRQTSHQTAKIVRDNLRGSTARLARQRLIGVGIGV